MSQPKGTVLAVYHVKCLLCKKKLWDTTEEGLRQKLKLHVDDECHIAAEMGEWQKQGIYQEMMALARGRALEQDLKKLIKKYGLEEVKQTLEILQQDQQDKEVKLCN